MVKFVVMWEVSRRPKNQNIFKQQCRNKDLLLYYFWSILKHKANSKAQLKKNQKKKVQINDQVLGEGLAKADV